MTKLKLDIEQLHELYHKQKLTMEKIAEMYGCTKGAVWHRMKVMGISSRDLSESHYGQKAWNKGKKYRVGIRGGFSRTVSRRIAKELLPHKCSLCGAIKNLVAHHKDGNVHNNAVGNIQILCRSCHCKHHDTARFFLGCGNPSRRTKEQWLAQKRL